LRHQRRRRRSASSERLRAIDSTHGTKDRASARAGDPAPHLHEHIPQHFLRLSIIMQDANR